MVVLAGMVPVTAVDSVRTAVVGWNCGCGVLLLPPPQAGSMARPRATISKMDRDVFFIFQILLEYLFVFCARRLEAEQAAA
jgi:hypothetical protein